MSEIEKMYENVGIEPEYRYDCNLSDTIKPIEVFPLRSCSKGEIKDYCTNKQDYRYCKVYKVNKIYPPFTAKKQLKLIKWLILNDFVDELDIFYRPFELMWVFKIYNVPEFANEKSACRMGADMTFEKGLASLINNLWQDLTEEEKQQVKGILK